MKGRIDFTVYPDVEHGEAFEDDADRADYLMRVCAAWDFGIPPYPETLRLLSGWREVFERYPLPRSAAYHAFRALFRWPPVAIAESPLPARWERSDAREERDDPCRFTA